MKENKGHFCSLRYARREDRGTAKNEYGSIGCRSTGTVLPGTRNLIRLQRLTARSRDVQ